MSSPRVSVDADVIPLDNYLNQAMITVVLENRCSKMVLARSAKVGNEEYLILNHTDSTTLLGQLDLYSVDVYTSDDMPRLIEELTLDKSNIENRDFEEHVDEIIGLTFTPFDEPRPVIDSPDSRDVD